MLSHLPIGIAKMLDLSTCHMPEPTDNDPDFGSLRSCEHEYGWIVFVPGGGSFADVVETNNVPE